MRFLTDAQRAWLRAWAAAFAARGFTVERQPAETRPARAEDDVHVVELRGKGVRAALGHPDSNWPPVAGALVADNVEVFDKWTKCPCRIRLGRDPERHPWDRTLIALAYLAANPDLASRAFGGWDTPFLWED